MTAYDICTDLDIERIKKKILQTSIVGWDRKISNTSLEKWLNNFSGEALGDVNAEHALAAWLLMQFTYYTENEVKELCKVLFRKYVNFKLNETQYKTSNEDIEEKVKKIIRHSVFVKLGNPSESSSRLLYDFRITNGLPKLIFNEPKDWETEVANREIEDVILLDDVTLSGAQAVSYLKSIPKVPCDMHLLTFFATPVAIERLHREAPHIRLLYTELLDNRTKLFSEESFVFSNKDCMKLKEAAFKLCSFYGERIVNHELPASESYMKNWPLGFADGQQMFSFYYNTPDNTLPIFWCESSHWSAAFIRHPKVNAIEGVVVSDEQYW